MQQNHANISSCNYKSKYYNKTKRNLEFINRNFALNRAHCRKLYITIEQAWQGTKSIEPTFHWRSNGHSVLNISGPYFENTIVRNLVVGVVLCLK